MADFFAWYEVLLKRLSKTSKSTDTVLQDSQHPPETDLSDNTDDDLVTENYIDGMAKTFTLFGGLQISKRLMPKVLRSVRYNKDVDPKNYYRERLMLYLPWRNELRDLCKGYQSFEQFYANVEAVAEQNCQPYECHSSILDQIAKDIPFDDLSEYSVVAPNTQHAEDQDFEIGSQASNFFGCFEPQSSVQSQYNLLDDTGMYPRSENVLIESQVVSDSEFRGYIQLLNKEQMELFYHVLSIIKSDSNPLRLFLSGGAGTGKSFVLNALFQAVSKYLVNYKVKSQIVLKLLR